LDAIIANDTENSVLSTISKNMTENYTTFPNPPITEALIDIRTDLPKEVTLDNLILFYDEVKERFPLKEEKVQWKTGFKVSPGLGPQISEHVGGIDGYLFRSSDKSKIVQSRLDGFTFNKLKPYEDWGTFCNEAKELWIKFLKIAKPKNTTRLALRYINQIDIPLPFKEFNEYILTIPEIAPGLPNALSEFLMKLVISNDEIKSKAIILETMKNVETKNGQKILPLIFDIDVFRQISLDPNSEEIWNIMSTLRNFKNDIFFNSLTDKAKELFK